MSFLRTLDEIPSSELITELNRRQHRRRNGLCPYCKKPLVDDKGEPVGPSNVKRPADCTCRFGKVDEYHEFGVTNTVIRT